MGHPVDSFESAQQFLEAYRDDRPGCLLVDVRMPGMSGLELQEVLCKRKVRIPIILITGHGDIPSAVQAMDNGAITYLEKPCPERKLWGSIKRALSQASKNQINDAERAEIQARVDTLTEGEVAVMKKIFDGVSNKQMVVDLEIGLRTVELRRAKVLQKMKVGSLAELVRTILRWGGFVDPDKN